MQQMEAFDSSATVLFGSGRPSGGLMIRPNRNASPPSPPPSHLILGANQQVDGDVCQSKCVDPGGFSVETDRNPTVPTNQLPSLRQQFPPPPKKKIPQSQRDDIDLT